MDYIRAWCYRQCELQHATTPADIAGMEAAWSYAETVSERPDNFVDESVIEVLGMMIDPVANPGGRFRSGPAVFMDGGSAAPAQNIGEFLNNLLRNGIHFTPAEFYRELMWIHPFKDGNGRMGALVYNILNGTIDNPVDPPEYR